jgi:hypothetical protein|uniref:Uncharacterized protein n=1 Tax=Sipha flava TaxID=143950 RepID=A0A2S2R8W8_9HEMI
MIESHAHHKSPLYYIFLSFIIKLNLLKKCLHANLHLFNFRGIVFILFFYINSVLVIIIPIGLNNNDELMFLLKVSIQHFMVSSLIVIICFKYFTIISSNTLFYVCIILERLNFFEIFVRYERKSLI